MGQYKRGAYKVWCQPLARKTKFPVGWVYVTDYRTKAAAEDAVKNLSYPHCGYRYRVVKGPVRL